METESSNKGLDIESTTMQSGFGYTTTTNNKENGFCRAKVFLRKKNNNIVALPQFTGKTAAIPIY